MYLWYYMCLPLMKSTISHRYILTFLLTRWLITNYQYIEMHHPFSIKTTSKPILVRLKMHKCINYLLFINKILPKSWLERLHPSRYLGFDKLSALNLSDSLWCKIWKCDRDREKVNISNDIQLIWNACSFCRNFVFNPIWVLWARSDCFRFFSNF